MDDQRRRGNGWSTRRRAIPPRCRRSRRSRTWSPSSTSAATSSTASPRTASPERREGAGGVGPVAGAAGGQPRPPGSGRGPIRAGMATAFRLGAAGWICTSRPERSGDGNGCYAFPSNTGGRPRPDGWRRLRKTSVRIPAEPCCRRAEPCYRRPSAAAAVRTSHDQEALASGRPTGRVKWWPFRMG